jgi:cellulose synthase/poly-beta-1,6-N-acetylglucosamine synthase-like glycosyltransferase
MGEAVAMTIPGGILLGLYFLCMALLAVYGAHRLWLVVLYLRHRRAAHQAPRPLERFPRLTIQLPIYNEVYVAARIIDAACGLDYPRERLEIQVLDDSTDETTALCLERVREHRRRGIDIRCLHRASREGFKAGALQEGLRVATGEFVAIFDADFLPPPDFALRILPYFSDPKLGMVQARWGHLNRGHSTLTRVQSIFLDGHFVIEQAARSRAGRFFNFNGTAGIWRRECIESAGGWQMDTLTEDLDLSYRAQMAGWRFLFLPEVVAPAELPVEMNAFKSQQHRWAKGSIQTGLKLLPAIVRDPSLPARIKTEAVFHLTNNVAYLLMVVVSLLYFPVMRIRERLAWHSLLALDLPILLFGSGSVLAFYLLSQKELRRGGWAALRDFPALMSVGMGLSMNNARAVLEAVVGRRTEFVRTPKPYPAPGGGDELRPDYRGRPTAMAWVELGVSAYFLLSLIYALQAGIYASVPFVALFLSGYLYSSWSSLRESFLARRASGSVAS